MTCLYYTAVLIQVSYWVQEHFMLELFSTTATTELKLLASCVCSIQAITCRLRRILGTRSF